MFAVDPGVPPYSLILVQNGDPVWQICKCNACQGSRAFQRAWNAQWIACVPGVVVIPRANVEFRMILGRDLLALWCEGGHRQASGHQVPCPGSAHVVSRRGSARIWISLQLISVIQAALRTWLVLPL